MPKDFSRLHIAVPDFHDRNLFLQSCGHIVIEEMINNIDNRLKPDGSSQRPNSPGYAAEKMRFKGYDTPLKGIASNSPYMARHSQVAWVREFVHPDTLYIRLGLRRAAIGRMLQLKGFWFMGITRRAEERIRIRTSQYFRGKIIEMARKSGVRIPSNG